MNTKLLGALAFTIGAAVGSLVTWKLIETKYKQIADEEIADVVDHFTKKFESKTSEPEQIIGPIEVKEEENQVVADYSAAVRHYQGTEENEEGGGESMENMKPFVIPPEEFGDLDEYEAITLNYYEGDEVLTDDWHNVIEDVEGMVGKDFATHFGEYEDDSVFIRNHKRKADYEILRDERSFASIKDRLNLRYSHQVDYE